MERPQAWRLVYEGFQPESEGLREALCALGNGLFCTRGAAEWAGAGGADGNGEVHYPGTYIAGVYNRRTTEIQGRAVENEDLVNAPDWLPLTFRPEGGEWFHLGAVEAELYRQELDLRSGVLTRSIRFRDGDGRETSVRMRRLVSMHKPYLAAMELTLTAHGWSGRMEVRSALDGRVSNSGVERYRRLEGRHLTPLETGVGGEETICLVVQTNQSRIVIGEAARTRLLGAEGAVEAERSTHRQEGYICQQLAFEVAPEQPVRLEKVVALFTSKTRGIAEPGLDACTAAGRAPAFDRLLAGHATAWAQLWRRCDIRFEREERMQLILRLHIFHLLQTVSRNTVDLDAGVPARGLHGEAYRGHIFWDELFILPFLNYQFPEITESLLLYRYRRLDEARAAARAEGYRGAMYPWQSGANGREETQSMHLNPKSGRWLPDLSHHQRHVNAAIAYNVIKHTETTGSQSFMLVWGAEMLLEITRFWASIARYDAERDRYEIHGVMGPDEFHEQYPGSEEPGLENNAYTNVLVAWLMDATLRTLSDLPDYRRAELVEELGIAEEEVSRWADMSRKMYVPFHGEGLISQFEGYGELEELDWEAYRERYGDIGRLDRILEAEGDSANRYKLAKQADVLMLFYLFSEEELGRLFQRLGYPFSREMVKANIDYYFRRTSHGSTLSNVVHAAVLARYDPDRSWQAFCHALESDISDIQGGTTHEGIHLGAMAGTVDLIQRCYLGLELRDGVLFLDPLLPDRLDGLRLSVRYQGTWLDLVVSHDVLTVTPQTGGPEVVKVGVRDGIYYLAAGYGRRFAL